MDLRQKGALDLFRLVMARACQSLGRHERMPLRNGVLRSENGETNVKSSRGG